MVTGQLPLSPVVFWLLASSLARRPTEPRLPLGKVGEIPGGNKRRRSAGGKFARRRPLEERQGLDGVERTPRIRRTATKRRRRQTGDDGQELCDGPAAPNSRPRSGRPKGCEPCEHDSLPGFHRNRSWFPGSWAGPAHLVGTTGTNRDRRSVAGDHKRRLPHASDRAVRHRLGDQA
jgi:hypothetical protein